VKSFLKEGKQSKGDKRCNQEEQRQLEDGYNNLENSIARVSSPAVPCCMLYCWASIPKSNNDYLSERNHDGQFVL